MYELLGKRKKSFLDHRGMNFYDYELFPSKIHNAFYHSRFVQMLLFLHVCLILFIGLMPADKYARRFLVNCIILQLQFFSSFTIHVTVASFCMKVHICFH